MNHKSQIPSFKAPSSLVRPQYSPGLLLNDDDLTQAVDYTRNLSRMLFKSLLGCGVVCGLVVRRPELVCGKLVIKVEPGVALDCHGDPLHVPEMAVIAIDPTCGVEVPARLWVLIKRYDKHCAPRSALCSQDDDDAASVCTRIRDGYEVSLVSEAPTCACACAPADNGEKDPVPGAATVDKADSSAAAGASTSGAATAAGDNTPRAASSANEPCHADHYKGVCNLCCGADCASDCVTLARLDRATDGAWSVSHAVRRFIRPVLMPDPQVALETASKP